MAWLSVVGVKENGGHPSRIEPSFSNPPVVAAPPAETTHPMPHTVAANAFLFRAGDLRTHLYRVESGAICLYETRRSDRQSVIEFLFPGDYVGLGFLEKHHLSARALLDSTVTCVPIDALGRRRPRRSARAGQAGPVRRARVRGPSRRAVATPDSASRSSASPRCSSPRRAPTFSRAGPPTSSRILEVRRHRRSAAADPRRSHRHPGRAGASRLDRCGGR